MGNKTSVKFIQVLLLLWQSAIASDRQSSYCSELMCWQKNRCSQHAQRILTRPKPKRVAHCRHDVLFKLPRAVRLLIGEYALAMPTTYRLREVQFGVCHQQRHPDQGSFGLTPQGAVLDSILRETTPPLHIHFKHDNEKRFFVERFFGVYANHVWYTVTPENTVTIAMQHVGSFAAATDLMLLEPDLSSNKVLESAHFLKRTPQNKSPLRDYYHK